MSEALTRISDLPTDAQRFALFSGGNDSVVSTHVAYKNHDIDYTVYLDTNTGLPENKEHVKEVCQEYGWDLLIAQSATTLREFALGTEDRKPYGFPGPGEHSWVFRYLKDRQLQSIATRVDERPRYYNGVRKAESNRRNSNVTGMIDKRDRVTYVNVIFNWSDRETDAYREKHDLPKNPVAERIGRSGDCFCGAYVNRDTELTELEAHYPKHADWIKDLEKDVQEELGASNKNAYWGFGNMGEKELRAKMAENDENQMMLCSSCDVPNYPSPE